jgi:hypothetical protein
MNETSTLILPEHQDSRWFCKTHRVWNFLEAVFMQQDTRQISVQFNPEATMVDDVAVDDDIVRRDVGRFLSHSAVAEHDQDTLTVR